MPPFWPFRRQRRKGPDAVERALQTLRKRRSQPRAEEKRPPPEPFKKGEARELMHVSGNLRRHESWEKLRRHMEEHPGEGQMVGVGGGMELWATKPLATKPGEEGGRVFGLEADISHRWRGLVPHMMFFDREGKVITRGEGTLPR